MTYVYEGNIFLKITYSSFFFLYQMCFDFVFKQFIFSLLYILY